MYKIKSKYYKGFDVSGAINLIKLALKEDIGKSDLTSDIFIDSKSNSNAELIVKEKSIIAGIEVFKLVFYCVDENVKIKLNLKEGNCASNGDIIARISGNTKSILMAERLSLNIIQRMSGIANSVNLLTKKLNNQSIKILDTRKTTPNFRLFEKQAVKIGGGTNHRFGLYDMVLIKDNHIEANDGIGNVLASVEKIRHKYNVKFEIEVKNIDEFRLVREKGNGIIDIVMIDNFKIEDIKKVIKINKNLFKLELSGGINFNNINLYSKLNGIDFISVGAITHSVKSTDISLNFINK